MEEVQTMKDGKDTMRSFFRSKESKISKITELTNQIASADREIECLDLLYKIVVLQLNQATINFFKREKFGTYNHTINLYAVKQIENNSLKHDLYKQLRGINQKTSEAQLDMSIAMHKEGNRLSSALDPLKAKIQASGLNAAADDPLATVAVADE